MPGKHVGYYIQQARKLHNLTQRELAEKTGYSHSHIRKIERGEKMPSFEAFKRIAAFLNIPVESLMDDNNLDIWYVIPLGSALFKEWADI